MNYLLNRQEEEATMIKELMKIKGMELAGRIIMPPIATYKCDDEGHVT